MAKEVLAILNIFVDSSRLEDVAKKVSEMEETVDVYEVTGEFDVVAVVKASDVTEFRRLLKDKILKIEGVKSTVTSMVLYTHKRDGRLVGE